MNFQDMVLAIDNFWSDNGCAIIQPYDLEVGAGTFHVCTFFRALGPEPWNVAYVQPSRRPTDGRYGMNHNRLQQYYQYQVLLKPSPLNVQQLYLQSMNVMGINVVDHDIRFIEDDWESPTLGATGLGWEVWVDGMEVSQFTYFQQIGSIEVFPVSVELTYGLERICMHLQGVDSVYDLKWNDVLTYGDLHNFREKEQSIYNFEIASIDMLFDLFDKYELEANFIIKNGLVIPAYEYVLKCSHCFNLIDSRSAISVTERENYISRIRNLSRICASMYFKQRKDLGFPLLKNNK